MRYHWPQFNLIGMIVTQEEIVDLVRPVGIVKPHNVKITLDTAQLGALSSTNKLINQEDRLKNSLDTAVSSGATLARGRAVRIWVAFRTLLTFDRFWLFFGMMIHNE